MVLERGHAVVLEDEPDVLGQRPVGEKPVVERHVADLELHRRGSRPPGARRRSAPRPLAERFSGTARSRAPQEVLQEGRVSLLGVDDLREGADLTEVLQHPRVEGLALVLVLQRLGDRLLLALGEWPRPPHRRAASRAHPGRDGVSGVASSEAHPAPARSTASPVIRVLVKPIIVILPPGADSAPHGSFDRMNSKSRTSGARVASCVAKARLSGDLPGPPGPFGPRRARRRRRPGSTIWSTEPPDDR